VAQEVGHLPSKCKVLSSNTSTTKNKKVLLELCKATFHVLLLYSGIVCAFIIHLAKK
jgi:hypothetical protein